MALLLLDVKRGAAFARRKFHRAGWVIALLALIATPNRVLPLTRFGSRLPMALNSAIVLNFSRSRRWRYGRAAGDDGNHERHTGGSMARRFVAAAILIPLILGALRFSSEKHGFLKSNPAFRCSLSRHCPLYGGNW